MCGRFTIIADAIEFQRELDLGEMPSDWNARYNVAPGQPVAVVTDHQDRKVTWMKWGLVPSWAKDANMGNRLINARAETVELKPAFRRAFAQRRCLILADGFFEWKRDGGKQAPSVPYFIHLANRRPFTFAGLWELWNSPEGETLQSCTIITCPANALVNPIHERMPVILKPENRWEWLMQQNPQDLKLYLKSYPEKDMISYAVSRFVNRPEFDRPECIQPAAGG